jgi:hypothetical protein
VSAEQWPDPLADRPGWAPQPPAAIVAVPAGAARQLRGRRVLVGLPGFGWRGDLRGDDPVVQGSRTYVPVLPEAEWYRAEAEQTEVFAPLVPVDRVWVEVVEASRPPGSGTHADDVVSRLVSLDEPPRREPVPVIDAGALSGRRVVRIVHGDERRDLRAVTELHAGADGDICVRVTTELEWYRWGWSGKMPQTLEVPVHLLWVE